MRFSGLAIFAFHMFSLFFGICYKRRYFCFTPFGCKFRFFVANGGYLGASLPLSAFRFLLSVCCLNLLKFHMPQRPQRQQTACFQPPQGPLCSHVLSCMSLVCSTCFGDVCRLGICFQCRRQGWWLKVTPVVGSWGFALQLESSRRRYKQVAGKQTDFVSWMYVRASVCRRQTMYS